jgi:phosphoribosylformimino-5-aminoimidazole carboxamide ribotide isomerase
VAVLIPSIDLMGGKIVQLVQGAKKALEFDDFEHWTQRFAGYPLVQLIDLDAAMRQGSNRELVARFATRLPCQVGGGIRTAQDARGLLDDGARRVIFGSALFKDGQVQTAFAAQLARELGAENLVFAVDARGGRVAVRGWKETVELDPVEAIRQLEPYCCGFLYTHIDSEGLMQGFPMEIARKLRHSTRRGLIAAGGITTAEEIEELDAMRIDAVVGMAIYTGRIKV